VHAVTENVMGAATPERKNSDLNTTQEQSQGPGGREGGKKSSELENNMKLLKDQAIIRDLNNRQRQGEGEGEDLGQEQGEGEDDQMQSIWPFSMEDETIPLTADAGEVGQEQGVRKGREVEVGEEEEDSKGQGVGQSLAAHPATDKSISSPLQVVETVPVDLKTSSVKVLQEVPSQQSDISPSPHTGAISPSPHTGDISPSPHTGAISPSPHTGAISVSINTISTEIPIEQHAAIVETKGLGLEDRRRNRKDKKEKAEKEREKEKEKEDKKERGHELFIPVMSTRASDSDIIESALGDRNQLKMSGVCNPRDICVGRCLESVEKLKSHHAVKCAQFEKRIADLVRGERRSRVKQGLPCLPAPVWILTLNHDFHCNEILNMNNFTPHDITAESRLDALPATVNSHQVYSGTDGSTHAQTAIEDNASSYDDESLALQPTASREDWTPCSVSPPADSPLDVLTASPRVQCLTCTGCITRTMETSPSPLEDAEMDALTPALLLLKDRLELVNAMECDGTSAPSAGGRHCVLIT
jgi:hypothetical protein